MDERQISRKEKADKNTKKSPQQTALECLHDIVFLLAILVVVFVLIFRIVVVSGPSMRATLVDGDYLLILSSTFTGEPERGDIIVASKPDFKNGEPIIKRVIATGGQTVDIDFNTGIVYVDGIALDESYTLTPTNQSQGTSFPLTVNEGFLFVMGDNRNQSKDSRNPQIGLIDQRQVLGKAVFLLFPGTHNGEVNRDFGRIGVPQ